MARRPRYQHVPTYALPDGHRLEMWTGLRHGADYAPSPPAVNTDMEMNGLTTRARARAGVIKSPIEVWQGQRMIRPLPKRLVFLWIFLPPRRQGKWPEIFWTGLETERSFSNFFFAAPRRGSGRPFGLGKAGAVGVRRPLVPITGIERQDARSADRVAAMDLHRLSNRFHALFFLRKFAQL